MSKDTDQSDLPPAGDRVLALWQQLKEHRIAQWSVGDVAVAYGIQHAVTLTSEALDWPHGIERVSMILLALGLPLAMTLAWYHGERVSRGFSRAEFSILSVLLLMAAFLFYVFVRPPEQVASRSSAAVQAVTAVAPATKPAGISVAVLPFLNLSGDPKEEYFSDGMTEEITSALAKVSGLAVVARTSAFQFKGVNKDVRTIGQTLGANYVIEGSVRKDGNEVRITAQLIKADTGDHVWTDSYDRNLTAIFAVQEDVARAIAAALQVPLGLSQGETLVSNRDVDPQSYQDYLRAKALVRSRNVSVSLDPSIKLLEGVLVRQPNYAPAWALLAQSYTLAPNYNPVFYSGSTEELRRTTEADIPKAEAAARRAIQLDPRNADAYGALGEVQTLRGKLLDAEQLFKQALNFDPLNPNILQWYSDFIASTGRLQEAVAMREQLSATEPLVPVFNGVTARVLLAAGDNAKALTFAEALPSNYGQRAHIIAAIYAAMGRYNEAADAALNAPRDLHPPGAVETAARLLRAAPAPAPRENIPYLGVFSFVFAYVGLPERALQFNEHMEDANYISTAYSFLFWQHDYVPARKTERFKALVRKIGLVDYWRARGWPQFCHPTSGDDFACN